MQLAVIEFARHVAGLEGAHSTEFDVNSPHPVVGLITEWRNADGSVELRNASSDLGGTMRLGAQACHLKPETLAAKVYGQAVIQERHRHRYEVNNQYLDRLTQAGLVLGGVSEKESLCEMIELTDHPWFIGCQFHPEFCSNPREGHPLFIAFIRAAKQHHAQS